MDGVRTLEGGLEVTKAMVRARIRVDGRLAAVAGAFGDADVGLQWLWRPRLQDRTRQEALADWAGVSLGGRSVDRMTGQWQKGAVRLGVEWLAAGPGLD